MPKVNIGLYTEKDREFIRVIEGCTKRKGKCPKDLMSKAHISSSTYYSRMKNPEDLTIGELRAFISTVDIPEEDMLNVLYQRRNK